MTFIPLGHITNDNAPATGKILDLSRFDYLGGCIHKLNNQDAPTDALHAVIVAMESVVGDLRVDLEDYDETGRTVLDVQAVDDTENVETGSYL